MKEEVVSAVLRENKRMELRGRKKKFLNLTNIDEERVIEGKLVVKLVVLLVFILGSRFKQNWKYVKDGMFLNCQMQQDYNIFKFTEITALVNLDIIISWIPGSLKDLRDLGGLAYKIQFFQVSCDLQEILVANFQQKVVVVCFLCLL